jgi:Arc/MetJ-type ribon-helix-helix transcriptional regulator
VRASTAELMGCLTESEWLREGTHSEVGRYGLDTWLRIYAQHAHRHAAQIRTARAS